MSEEETHNDPQASLITGLVSLAVFVAVIAALVVIHDSARTPETTVRQVASAPPPPRPRPKMVMSWSRQASRSPPLTVQQPEAATKRDFKDIKDAIERKEAFVHALLPLVLAENEDIRRQRDLTLQTPPPQLYDRYRVKPGNRAELLRRVDIVPVSLALAQAAIESGWGTSRFVHEANNIFGERTYKKNARGIDPKEATGFKITKFGSLARSIRSYMHNLNSHPAYAEFRKGREEIRNKGGTLTGMELAMYLEAYSELRAVYIRRIRQVIRENELQILDRARLARR